MSAFWNNRITYAAIGLIGLVLIGQRLPDTYGDRTQAQTSTQVLPSHPTPPVQSSHLPRLLKFNLSLSSPKDLKVRQGDTVAVGEVLADRVMERSRLTREHQSLELAYQQIQERKIIKIINSRSPDYKRKEPREHTPNMRHQLPQPDRHKRKIRRLGTTSASCKKQNSSSAIARSNWLKSLLKSPRSIISSHPSVSSPALIVALSAASKFRGKLTTTFLSNLLLLSVAVLQLYPVQAQETASPHDTPPPSATESTRPVFRYPFTIILKDQVKEESVNHDHQLKIDPGAKTTGIAILQEDKVVWAAEVTHRGFQIRDNLTTRRPVRPSRRNKATRAEVEKRVTSRDRTP